MFAYELKGAVYKGLPAILRSNHNELELEPGLLPRGRRRRNILQAVLSAALTAARPAATMKAADCCLNIRRDPSDLRWRPAAGKIGETHRRWGAENLPNLSSPSGRTATSTPIKWLESVPLRGERGARAKQKRA